MNDLSDNFCLEEELEKKRINLELFEKIVGEHPMDQIDWINKHGLEKFTYWWRCYEMRTIYSPATVEQYKEPIPDYVTTYVRGGRGNAKLFSWDHKPITIHHNANNGSEKLMSFREAWNEFTGDEDDE